MARKISPPKATIRRLSIYLRCLTQLEEEEIDLISSKSLAERLDLNPAQVRKDLAYFGEFGKRGVGYSVSKLRGQIIKILGLQKHRNVGIIGAGGQLGQVLASYKGFEKRNFKIVALFEKDPNQINREIENVGKIHSVSELHNVVKREKVEIIILSVSATAVHEAFEQVILSGVKAVLNFAPVKLKSTDEVIVHNVDLALELESLSYHLSLKESKLELENALANDIIRLPQEVW